MTPPHTEHFLDRAFEKSSEAIGARITRRSMLGKAAGYVLAVLGIELVAPEIVDRRAYRAQGEVPNPCPRWQDCGAQGTLCAGCPGGGSDSGCPTGCTVGNSYWWAR